MRASNCLFFLFSNRILLATFLILASTTYLLYSQEKENTDEEKQLWNASSGVHYYSRYTCYGVDLSEDQPAFSFNSEISHESGVSAGIEVFALTGTNGGYDHSAIHIGYEHLFSSIIKLAGTYTYQSYATDTMTILAGMSNDL
jgi:hypothetical protein